MTQARGTESTGRLFSIAEVNALIPSLSNLVEGQLREQSEIEQGLARVDAVTHIDGIDAKLW